MRILYLDLDTLRPDHLGCYGYHRDTSPHIDSIAAQGTRFTNYYCSDAPCQPSRTAFMTGQFGIHSGLVSHEGTAADVRVQGKSRGFWSDLGEHSLPATLRRAGLKTVCFTPFAGRHSSWSFYAGFAEMHDSGRGGQESAEEVTPEVLDWIDRNAKGDNWYLHVNYWDAHTPYRAPASFGNPFEKEPIPSWLTDQILARHQRQPGPNRPWEISNFTNHVSPEFPRQPGQIRDRKDLKRLFDGYDCGIRYMDSHLGQLFAALKKAGIWDDLAIVISADHGENFGELGMYSEHGTADQATCHIPMIVRWPGGKRGVDHGFHYNLDFAPTVAGLLGAKAPSRWDGQSYAPSILKGTDCGRDELVLSQCEHVCQRSVRFDRWLWMRTYHDGFHLWPDEMLFDLKKDPWEQDDVAAKNPQVCWQAAHRLEAWHTRMMKAMPYGNAVDPLWTVMNEGGAPFARGRLKKYCGHLKKTGRAWAIPELKKKHPKEF
jgi:arylsulfatase A-like enzyme